MDAQLLQHILLRTTFLSIEFHGTFVKTKWLYMNGLLIDSPFCPINPFVLPIVL